MIAMVCSRRLPLLLPTDEKQTTAPSDKNTLRFQLMKDTLLLRPMKDAFVLFKLQVSSHCSQHKKTDSCFNLWGTELQLLTYKKPNYKPLARNISRIDHQESSFIAIDEGPAILISTHHQGTCSWCLDDACRIASSFERTEENDATDVALLLSADSSSAFLFSLHFNYTKERPVAEG